MYDDWLADVVRLPAVMLVGDTTAVELAVNDALLEVIGAEFVDALPDAVVELAVYEKPLETPPVIEALEEVLIGVVEFAV